LFRKRAREDRFRSRTKQEPCEGVIAAWQQLLVGALEAEERRKQKDAEKKERSNGRKKEDRQNLRKK
jgi:hypothetical protein